MADFICGRVASFHLIFVQNYLTADSATLIFVDVFLLLRMAMYRVTVRNDCVCLVTDLERRHWRFSLILRFYLILVDEQDFSFFTGTVRNLLHKYLMWVTGELLVVVS